jgi:Fe-S-cluster-containing hydrogenase component 2
VQAIDEKIVIDRAKCIDCLCCQELCPQGAVSLVRVNPLARRLIPLDRMLKDRPAGEKKEKGHW